MEGGREGGREGGGRKEGGREGVGREGGREGGTEGGRGEGRREGRSEGGTEVRREGRTDARTEGQGKKGMNESRVSREQRTNEQKKKRQTARGLRLKSLLTFYPVSLRNVAGSSPDRATNKGLKLLARACWLFSMFYLSYDDQVTLVLFQSYAFSY